MKCPRISPLLLMSLVFLGSACPASAQWAREHSYKVLCLMKGITSDGGEEILLNENYSYSGEANRYPLREFKGQTHYVDILLSVDAKDISVTFGTFSKSFDAVISDQKVTGGKCSEEEEYSYALSFEEVFISEDPDFYKISVKCDLSGHGTDFSWDTGFGCQPE